ncbi:carbohydrate kinase family protein [Devosia lacusdianchii]|uniref:carbohydrate kinase family protein n=1 Tax=Devosia lacusdianchii TaxID=2917991 RepID=UPI001F0550E1|nr:carbohydrate kinase family protein [Devosia sp. JXJ CY 41]
MTRCDVLVAGEYFCDLVFAGLDGAPRMGTEHMAEDLAIMPGGTYTMALALTRLGVATRWANTFGNDLFSRYVRDMAAADGIDGSAFTLVDRPVQRVSVAYAAGGERGFISFSRPAVTPPAPALYQTIDNSWLLQTFRFEPDWIDFVAAQRARGAKVLLDCRGGDFDLDTAGVETLIRKADIFSPNAEEALRLTGAGSIDEAGTRLARLAPTIVIKCGEAGAEVFGASSRFSIPSPRVSVVDTVGAGDSFNAGLLLGLVRGSRLDEAVQLAVFCGALSTTATGGRACPTAEALDAFRHQLAATRPDLVVNH